MIPFESCLLTGSSPVFSHVSSCLKGLATIRSRKLQNVMIDEFDQLQNLHSAAYHLTLTSNTALGLWLDVANCCILLNSVTFSFIIFNNGKYSLLLYIREVFRH